jgi:hypothetical protein
MPFLACLQAAVVAAATFIDQLAEARFGLPKPTNAADTESTIECDVVWELAQGCCMVVGAWMAEENSLLQAETVAVALYLCNVLGEGKPDMRGERPVIEELFNLPNTVTCCLVCRLCHAVSS